MLNDQNLVRHDPFIFTFNQQSHIMTSVKGGKFDQMNVVFKNEIRSK